jgi:hypothetical protein
VVGDYMITPAVYNEFSPGNKGSGSYTGRAAIEIPLASLTWLVEGDWRHWQYTTTAGPVTTIGGLGSSTVPSFTAKEDDVDARIGIKVADPRLYLGVSYLWRNNNYGYPSLSGVGFGGEKLPDLDQPITVYGSFYYYPSLQGNYTTAVATPAGTLAYRAIRYGIGLDWNFIGPSFPVYLDLGFLGNQYRNKLNAPSDINEYGGYVGLGLHF